MKNEVDESTFTAADEVEVTFSTTTQRVVWCPQGCLEMVLEGDAASICPICGDKVPQ